MLFTYVCMHTYMYIHIHTYTCTHTYIGAYIHTYIHTYIRTCMQACMHACIHACQCALIQRFPCHQFEVDGNNYETNYMEPWGQGCMSGGV